MHLPLLLGSFVAGMLMFLAPCTLPIMPGYLAFIAGVPLEALKDPKQRRRARLTVFRNAAAFVVGFSAVFILLGASAGLLGTFVGPWRYLVAKLGGVVVILFGLTMLGLVPLSALQRDKRIRLPAFLVLGRLSSSTLIGALFALGWSPCIGPILGTVLLIASDSATVSYGVVLLAAFSAGLAVPFLITAFLVSEASLFLARISWFVRVLSLVGGVSLVLGGVLMLMGATDLTTAWGARLFEQWGFGALQGYL